MVQLNGAGLLLLLLLLNIIVQGTPNGAEGTHSVVLRDHT